MSRRRLTAQEQAGIFLRWIAGNALLADGYVPETAARIGAAYNVTAAAVSCVVQRLTRALEAQSVDVEAAAWRQSRGLTGNGRVAGRKRARCAAEGCERQAVARGYCRNCRRRIRWLAEPGFRERETERHKKYLQGSRGRETALQRSARYRARRREQEGRT